MSIPIDISPETMADFCRRRHIRRLGLFGSILRDDFRPDSDVDVLVEFEPGAQTTYLDMVDIQDELAEMFGRPVDVGTYDMLSHYIRDHVMQSARTIYERQ